MFVPFSVTDFIDRARVVYGDRIVETVPTYRGEGRAEL